MENETEKIFEEQLTKLPKEVVTFISSASWDSDADEIGELFNLSPEELVSFKREVTFVLVGLIHPDEFVFALEDIGIEGAVLEALVANVEKKIFAPIRPALIAFFEKEDGEKTSETTTVPIETFSPTAQMWDRISGAPTGKESAQEESLSELPSLIKGWGKTPDNLPIEEEVLPLIPPIPPKIRTEESSHPFEEKMKQNFTAATQTTNEPTPELIIPERSRAPEPKSSSDYRADPYREPVE
jgi:hypothetical protein